MKRKLDFSGDPPQIISYNDMFNSDDITLTNRGYIRSYPGKQPIERSIAVLPELHNDDVSKCIGVCSDYIVNYNLKLKFFIKKNTYYFNINLSVKKIVFLLIM